MGSFQGPESSANGEEFGDCAGDVRCVLGDLAYELGEVCRSILGPVGKFLETHGDCVSAVGRIGQWRAEGDSWSVARRVMQDAGSFYAFPRGNQCAICSGYLNGIETKTIATDLSKKQEVRGVKREK